MSATGVGEARATLACLGDRELARDCVDLLERVIEDLDDGLPLRLSRAERTRLAEAERALRAARDGEGRAPLMAIVAADELAHLLEATAPAGARRAGPAVTMRAALSRRAGSSATPRAA